MASRDREQDSNDCKNKGNECLANKQFDKAIEWYSEGIKLFKNHVLFSNRSAAYLSKGFSDSALKDANECIALKPDFAKGYSRKGAALHALQKYPDAISAYKEGLEIDPDNAGLKQGLESVEAAMAGPSMNFGEDESAGLSSLFGAEFVEKVKSHPKLSKYAEDPSFMQILNTLQANPQMLQFAISDPRFQECFKEILGINFQAQPENNPEDEEKARQEKKEREKECKAKAEEDERKRKEEEERIRREKETPEEKEKRENQEAAIAAKNEGNLFYKKREFDKAIECYEKAKSLDPDNCVFFLNIASVKLEQNDLDSCLENCDKAINLGRSMYAPFEQIARAYERKGNAYMKHKKYSEAAEEFNKALLENHTLAVAEKLKEAQVSLKINQAEAYLDAGLGAEAKEKGNEHFKKGEFPAAIDQYSEAIKRDPSNAVYYGNRASAYIKLADFGSAMSDVDKALQIDPSYVKMQVRKGNIHFFLKEYHKCLREYQSALDIEPNNVEAIQGLQKTQYAIQMSQGEGDSQRSSRALEDPEIRNILSDPVVRQVLEDMTKDPSTARQHMSNPEVAKKIETLIAAGVIQTR